MSTTTLSMSATDERRFSELMEQTYRKVYNLAFRLSGSRPDAEDLTQEAFYRAYRSFKDYEGDKPFENWIFRILTRLFLDLLRSRRRRIKAMSYDAPLSSDGADENLFFEIPDQEPNPEAHLLQNSFSEDVQAALSALSPDQRLLVTLADVEQMPYKDIAELMGKPVGTIRSRLHRAHKQMRSKLEDMRRKREKSMPMGRPLMVPTRS